MTVTPAADPCVGNLATPVNSGYFMKGLINNLPLYRPGISPNFRGLETGAAFGYLLFGPFTICGPLRATEYQQTAGLLAAIDQSGSGGDERSRRATGKDSSCFVPLGRMLRGG